MNRRTLLGASAGLIGASAFGRNALADAMNTIKVRKKLMVALDLGSPPFGMTDAQMQPTGSDVETSQLLAKDWGLELELLQTTAPNRIPVLLTNKADLVIASFSVTEERRRVVDFSDPYGVIQVVVAAPTNMQIKDYATLAGKRVGTTRGSSNDKEFTERNTGAQIIRYDDDATLLTALVSGQVDIMATSPQIMAAVNKRSTSRQFDVKLVMRTNPYAIGIRKGEDKLRVAVNEWVHANLRNGKLNEIYRRYNGVELPPEMLA
jgi:polar amino acid transport system substrate-binding protein